MEEASTLGSGNFFEIGAHTMTHPTLPAHSPQIRQAEIRDSKAACERLWGRHVTSFSYPYGEFTGKELDALRNQGFTAACSTLPGRIRGTVNCFRLPRRYVGNWDGAEFERRLLSR
jgi:peptidoglycan/xylan/chitin deacetylase (PgdA/CDA1 family)